MAMRFAQRWQAGFVVMVWPAVGEFMQWLGGCGPALCGACGAQSAFLLATLCPWLFAHPLRLVSLAALSKWMTRALGLLCWQKRTCDVPMLAMVWTG